jgi:hypothetical protein
MRANEAVTAWAIVAPFILFALLGHDLATRDDVRLQTLSAKACEQRVVDGEKARKQAKDEKECRELARDAYVLLGQSPPDDQKYITMFQVSYEKCMEVRGSKP